MSQDMLFRAIVGALGAALYLVRLAYAHPFMREAPRSTMVVCAGCVWAFVLAAYVAGFEPAACGVLLPGWLRGLGAAALLLCLPVSLWIHHTLGVHFSVKLTLLPGHRLIRTGPYRWVRHPMYATLFVCVAAASLASANLLVMAAGALITVTIVARIKKEDSLLYTRFGADYQVYRKNTGALVPKWYLFS